MQLLKASLFALMLLVAALLPQHGHAQTPSDVALAFAGPVDGDLSQMSAYTKHVVEDGYLSPAGISALYVGSYVYPSIPGTSYDEVDAWVKKTLSPGYFWIIAVPTTQPIEDTRPYHVRSSYPYAVIQLPALPGYWQSSLSHELVEMLSPTEVADPCESVSPASDGHYLYSYYLIDTGCVQGAV